MYAGRVVEEGTLDEIFYDPQHPYTWGLLGSLTRLDQAATAPAAADQRRAALAARPAGGLLASGPAARTSSTAAREMPALEARLAGGARPPRPLLARARAEARAARGRGPDRAGGAGVSASGEPLLEVTDLVKHFPIKRGLLIDREVDQVRAVDGVSFIVARGRDAGPGRRVGQRQVDALPRRRCSC